jgi:hypothetical protein
MSYTSAFPVNIIKLMKPPLTYTINIVESIIISAYEGVYAYNTRILSFRCDVQYSDYALTSSYIYVFSAKSRTVF